MALRRRRSTRSLAVAAALLISVFCVRPAAAAELKLRVVEGFGTKNKIKKGGVSRVVVQAEDENGRPVSDATVVFQLPPSGPGGTFPGTESSAVLTATTGANGQAAAVFQPNNIPGEYKIKVQALKESPASIEIIQVNDKGGINPIVWALVAGGAAGGLLAARSKDSGGTAPAAQTPTTPVATPTTITAGAGTFGRPQ